ncbi:hypothetical protein ACGFZB_35525 [Streptomyces cinerochromogenes]|uniref:Uncharacterized protein n=1 Tax=Streptomyces cinerochromogenes TaxID=66422 RepID=A0ABW7BIS7_9ACTN
MILVKPEVLGPAVAVDTMREILRVLSEGDTTVLRCALVPAPDFRDRGRLQLHYPRLHRVAADGVQALCSDARRELATFTDTSQTDEVLGAFEAMTYESELPPETLEHRCRQAGIHKLGSGSYVSAVDLNGRPVAVLNGFLPALAASYGDPKALVSLLECHSWREIRDLRSHLLGALHPANATLASLRGAVGALAGRQYGIELSEGRNGVHLSAGHLEGMFQAWRYFAAADGHGIESTGLGQSLTARDVSMASVATLASDPNLDEGSARMVAPHGITEDLGREEVLERVWHWCATGKGTSS